MKSKLYLGDCIDTLKIFPKNCIDSCVTDPPYEFGFMNKKWDNTGIAYNTEMWKEVFRVLKPGAHLLAFGGTRTYHRMACAIEDAGFEIRDQLQWLYGSGFPKSHNISKAIDKEAGVERQQGELKTHGRGKWNLKIDNQQKGCTGIGHADGSKKVYHETLPETDEAKTWEGWGTALKPANEPIVLARKPPSEKTIAKNVLKHGTGAINIEASRIPVDPEKDKSQLRTLNRNARTDDISGQKWGMTKTKKDTPQVVSPEGRFPANILLDEEAGEMLNQQSGIRTSGTMKLKSHVNKRNVYNKYNTGADFNYQASSGGASRFFYCAKVSKKERGEGNNHPTVKPIALMRYLIRLITPEDGIILDPFSGSGSTLLAAIDENMRYIGIEKEKEYYEIAKHRIEQYTKRIKIEYEN